MNTATVSINESIKKSHYDRLRLNFQEIASSTCILNNAKVFKNIVDFAPTSSSIIMPISLAIFIGEYTSGETEGSNMDPDTWYTRGLSIKKYDTIGCTLTASTVIIPKGSYVVKAHVPIRTVSNNGQQKVRVRDVNTDATLFSGSASLVVSTAFYTGGVSSKSNSMGFFTVSATTTIDLQSYIINSLVGRMYYTGSTFGENSVGSILVLERTLR